MQRSLNVFALFIVSVVGSLSGCSASAGEGDIQSNEEAVVAGTSCASSKELPSADGCNTCVCGADGTWACSKLDCGGDFDPALNVCGNDQGCWEIYCEKHPENPRCH